MVSNISLRHLSAFREVMRCGSVTEAAKALHRSQPAVSAMLSDMESQLGISLFERKGNRLIPKPEAQFFREEIETILDSFTRTVRMMGEISNLHAGQLRIACMPAASLFFVPRLISEFMVGRPGIDVTLMANSSTAVHEWVASQQFDVGIAEVPQEREAIRTRLVESLCVCAVRKDDPLADKDTIAPSDLADRPMAVLYPEHFTYQATVRAFEDSGFGFRKRFELRAFISGFDFVEQGLANCICDPISAISYGIYRGGSGALVFRPFKPDIVYPFAILTPSHKPSSLLADAFCKLIDRRIPEMLGLISSSR